MKKYFLPFIFITIPLYPINVPDIPEINIKSEIKEKYSDSFSVSSNSDFSDEKIYFSPGQSIFVRVKVSSNQNANGHIFLFDEKKSEIFKGEMKKSEGFYSSQLQAPGKEGLYYLRAEIKGEGISIIAEKNIYVNGKQNGNSSTSVNVDIENVLNASDSDYEDTENDIENKTENDLFNSNETPSSGNILRIVNNIIKQLIKEIFKYFSFNL